MKTYSLNLMAAVLVLGTACNVQHVVGGGQNHDAVACGGFASLPCNGGYVCVDDPNDACDPTHGGADCTGICVDPTQGEECGGLVANPHTCAQGYKCVDKPGSCSMTVDCPGICVLDAPVREHCGGFAGLQCPAGKDCIDDPTDQCDPNNGGADCGGICVPSAKPDAGTMQQDAGVTVPSECGGLVANPQTCPQGYQCVDNPNTCSMTVDCPGMCVLRVMCGGIAGITCAAGSQCIDDPNDTCIPTQGGADCSGICVPVKADAGTTQFCGGFAGLACPSGLRCVDDPSDTCDPNTGGADCTGICVP